MNKAVERGKARFAPVSGAATDNPDADNSDKEGEAFIAEGRKLQKEKKAKLVKEEKQAEKVTAKPASKK